MLLRKTTEKRISKHSRKGKIAVYCLWHWMPLTRTVPLTSHLGGSHSPRPPSHPTETSLKKWSAVNAWPSGLTHKLLATEAENLITVSDCSGSLARACHVMYRPARVSTSSQLAWFLDANLFTCNILMKKKRQKQIPDVANALRLVSNIFLLLQSQ